MVGNEKEDRGAKRRAPNSEDFEDSGDVKEVQASNLGAGVPEDRSVRGGAGAPPGVVGGGSEVARRWERPSRNAPVLQIPAEEVKGLVRDITMTIMEQNAQVASSGPSWRSSWWCPSWMEYLDLACGGN